MMFSKIYPSVLHGGGDDLENALAHLSWKEMAIMTGIVFLFFLLILLGVFLAE